jgi:hypothetical protein
MPTEQKVIPTSHSETVEVPVVSSNNASSLVGITAVVTPLALFLAKYYGMPLTADGIAALLAAMSVLSGIFMWAKNRWFDTTVTLSSVNLHGLAMKRHRR